MGNATSARLSKRADWGDRFLQYVNDSGDCWIWTGRFTDKGYGVLGIVGKEWTAHRLSYLLHHGDLPAGAFICHHCDNPPCVNPAHLYAGDQLTNLQDMMRRGRGRFLRGEQCGKTTIPWTTIKAIRADHRTGQYRQIDLARKYGVSQPYVSFIIRRQGRQDG